jgi:hypothetical protein
MEEFVVGNSKLALSFCVGPLFCFKLFAFLLEFVSGEEELFPDGRCFARGWWCCCAFCLDCCSPAAPFEVEGRGSRKDGDRLGGARPVGGFEGAEVNTPRGSGNPRAEGEGMVNGKDGV